jgi:SAM-dependent methyltransferase
MIKKAIKRFLPKSIYDILLMWKNNIQHFGLKGIYKEISFRTSKAPDGYRIPPSRLIFLVVGHGMTHDYYYAGKMIAKDIVNAIETHSCVSAMENILDFGCGCGRIIRHIGDYTKATLYGSDYNAKLIEWDRQNLPFARFSTNKESPGIPYKDGLFDLVYVISVFTHMKEDVQKIWVQEFARTLKSGGILFFTSHGNRFTELLDSSSFADYNSGKWAYTVRGPEGSNYFSSFFNHIYVEKNMTNDFTFLEHIPGREHTDLLQDIYIMKRK